MNRKKYIIKHSFLNITYLHAVLRIRIYFDPYHLSGAIRISLEFWIRFRIYMVLYIWYSIWYIWYLRNHQTWQSCMSLKLSETG